MNIKTVAVSDIKPYEKNAKTHPDEQIEHIANSIREFGFQQPLVLDSNNVVIIGHGRLLAAKRLGLSEVPVLYADDLTDAQVKALRLADNKTNESEWDFSALDAELDDLRLDFDMSDFGFDLDDDEEQGIDVQEDEVPEPPEEPRSKVGDLYQLGEHRLICGDSTDPAVIGMLMDGNTADISITSPPYGAGDTAKLRDHYEKGKEKRKSFYIEHEDNADDWHDLIRGTLSNMQEFSKGQFVNIQMLADNKTKLISIINDFRDSLVDVIIWDKMRSAPQMQSNILNNQYEFIFVFCGENASRTIPFGNFHGNISNMIELPCGVNEFSDVHRAVFPVQLPVKIMEIASNAQSVLDVFGGTGTTLIACEQLNRKCYMCELDPHYIDVIIQRWENLTGQKAVKIE